MVAALFVALSLLSSSPVLGSSACESSDAECSSTGDANAMIQIDLSTDDAISQKQVDNTNAKAFDSFPEASSDISVTMLDFKDQVVNGTAYGLETYGNASFGQRVWLASVSWVIYVVFALLIWVLCYPSAPVKVADPSDVEDPSHTFKEGHFQCLRNPSICLCACLCPGLRWADTMSLAGFFKISSGLSIVFFCALLNGVVGTVAVFGPFTLLLALYYRHELRKSFGLNYWSFSSCCSDFLYLLFCPWCALAQEARVMTHALQKGQPK